MSSNRRYWCAFSFTLSLLLGMVFSSPAAALTLSEARALAGNSDDGFPVVVNEQVLSALNAILGNPERKAQVHRALGEMATYQDAFLARIDHYGLPRELMAVPLIESGFKNLPAAGAGATGAGAAGIWQFMPQTARNFGMRVDEKVDERLDVARETDAGLRLLGALQLRFANWGLALAGYNEGENHVQWAIDEAGTRDPWELAAQGKLNDYGANIVAGAIVIRNPSLVQP